MRDQKQNRHAAALIAAGWAEWLRLPPATGHVPSTQAAPAATVEQQAALDRLLSFGAIADQFATANFLIGVAAGVVMIAAAIWLRRQRVEAYA